MTYCVGLKLDRGLVFMSDTRTNAGVDDISTVKKMTCWEVPGDRVIVILSAGNLATTQAVISLIDERSKAPADRTPTIMGAPSMFQVATILGDTLREVIRKQVKESGGKPGSFSGTLIVGGQVGDGDPTLFYVYPEGNFIEAGLDNPFFQSGETKYGRPILVRAYDPKMTFEQAIKLMLVSFDSTIRANAGVDPPIDMMVVDPQSKSVLHSGRFQPHDPYFAQISTGWGDALKQAFNSLPDFSFDTPRDDTGIV